MAREHARIWLDINSDDHFQSLSFDAQGFYTRIILTDPSLNYCGVCDWRPHRLTQRAPDLTLDRILAAAAELEHHQYLLFDLDTEEALVRSYIRRDELLRNPKMAATVIKAFPAVASKTLRAAIVTELQRVHTEHPDYSSWAHKDTGAGLSKLLAKDSISVVGYTAQYTYPDAVKNTYPDAVKNTYPDAVKNTYPDAVKNTNQHPGPEHQSFSVRNPSTSTNHHAPAPESGYVTGVRHHSAEPDPSHPPPPHCPKHPGGTDQPCQPCGAARRHRETWDAEQPDSADLDARRRAAFRTEIRDCPDCDQHGWALGDTGQPIDPATRCSNHDWETTNA